VTMFGQMLIWVKTLESSCTRLGCCLTRCNVAMRVLPTSISWSSPSPKAKESSNSLTNVDVKVDPRDDDDEWAVVVVVVVVVEFLCGHEDVVFQ